eukprot:3868782-Amphidinium_carterae.1
MVAVRDPCQYQPAHVLEWESATLKRVMRSTLACEAASASMAYDRNCYMRAIVAMAKGHTSRWQERLQDLPGMMVSDCRSLTDHIKKTSGAVSDRRVALDIQDLRDGIDAKEVVIHWQSTYLMMADGLTKKLVRQPALRKAVMGMGWQLGPEDKAVADELAKASNEDAMEA